MICTECGRPVKPVVAMDIDGTLGDYHGHFIRFAEAYTGQPLPEDLRYDGGMRFKDWAKEIWRFDEQTWRDIKLAYRQGAMKRSMPIFPGARNLADAVREAGAELWLTTTRPYQRLDNVDPDTRVWLERNHIQYDGLLYDKNKYPVLAGIVDPDRVVAVADDLPGQVSSAAETFGADRAILRKTEYNVKVPWPVSFTSLDLLASELVQRINRWKEEHA